MGDAGTATSDIAHCGVIRYVIADKSVSADERALFALAANKSWEEHELEVRDFRKAEDVVKGPEGLDVQGFTYVEHESALSRTDNWYEGRDVEDV